jgi:Rab-GTPase-TBC domain
MGNSCTCVSKAGHKHNPKVRLIPSTSSHKQAERNQNLWERVTEKYSSSPFPFEAFKQDDESQFQQLLFTGPPPRDRWKVWKSAFMMSRREITLDISEHDDSYSIEKDLDRTFPKNSYLGTHQGRQALKNILVSMVNNHPELGYCQGMNSLAGILLIVSDGNEKESYGMLENICFTMRGKGLFEYGFPLVVDLCEEFHKSLIETIPAMHRFIVEVELDDNLWITKWFMTLFSYSFKLDCVLRIWDAIFAYGLGFMVNIALGLVNYLQKDLINKTLEDILEYLPETNELSVDIDKVLGYSNKYSIKSNRIDLESSASSDLIQDEVDLEDPIQTKWNSLTQRQSKSFIEELSVSSSNNISKFSV